MSKLIFVFAVTIISIQISFSSSSSAAAAFTDNDVAILNSKRRNLITSAFAELRNAIWKDETFKLATDLMKDLKLWSNTVADKDFKKSEFQSKIDICTNLLNTLKADPGNCEIHTKLVDNYVQLRLLTLDNDAEFKDLQAEFSTKLKNSLIEQRDQLLSKLKDEMETFIRNLNEAEKHHAHDLIEWYDKFSNEKDLYVRQHMALDFPRLFSKGQLDANTACLPKSITDTIK